MTAKRLKKKKSLAPKISLAKLSNKKLNKLAKQGKIKKCKFGKKKLVTLIKERTNKLPKPQADGSHLEKEPDDTDEIPLEEADYEYFGKPSRNFSFLCDMKQLGKSNSKKGAGDYDGFEAVEGSKHAMMRARSEDQRTETKSLLPIKSKEKGIITREITIESNNVDENDSMEVNGEAQNGEEATDSAIETFASQRLTLNDAKQMIALLCMAVLEAPEENVSRLSKLRALLGDIDGTVPANVRVLALLSLLEVFKDIIPSYRIRILTSTERQQKHHFGYRNFDIEFIIPDDYLNPDLDLLINHREMKKDTKKLLEFEENLINQYRHYLETLESIITGKPVARKEKKRKALKSVKSSKGLQLSEDEIQNLKEVSLKCLCELLNTHPHFNYRTNIISLIVRFINNKNPKISDMVCDCVKKIFANDKAGDTTLEVVRLIGRIIKVRNFEVQPKVLNTFLSLTIKEVEKVDEPSKRKKTREERYKETSRRDRKREKRFAYLEKELNEFAVTDDTKRKLRLHTEIVNVVFLTYFRILKNARRSILLSAVLEGLAKFAHLINVTFFDDLFSVMTEFVDEGNLTYRESLHCIQTALTLLLGHGAALNIDPHRFYTHLYRTLFQLHAGSADDNVLIALRCLDIVINKRRRQVSHQRVLAFAKRICTLSLHTNPAGSLGLLSIVKNIMQDYPKADVLFEAESHGSGVFLPELEDPDHSNAHNTSLFELHLVSRSFHPSVKQYAEHILYGDSGRHKQLPHNLARKNAMELFQSFNPDLIFNEKTFQKTKQKFHRGRTWIDFLREDTRKEIDACDATLDKIDITAMDFTIGREMML